MDRGENYCPFSGTRRDKDLGELYGSGTIGKLFGPYLSKQDLSSLYFNIFPAIIYQVILRGSSQPTIISRRHG